MWALFLFPFEEWVEGATLRCTRGRAPGHISGQGQVKILPGDCKTFPCLLCLQFAWPSGSSHQACLCYWLTLPYLCVFSSTAEIELPLCLMLVLVRGCSDSLIQPAGLWQSSGVVLVSPVLLQTSPSWSPFLDFAFAAYKLSLLELLLVYHALVLPAPRISDRSGSWAGGVLLPPCCFPQGK